jgi:hypothetical protein
MDLQKTVSLANPVWTSVPFSASTELRGFAGFCRERILSIDSDRHNDLPRPTRVFRRVQPCREQKLPAAVVRNFLVRAEEIVRFQDGAVVKSAVWTR